MNIFNSWTNVFGRNSNQVSYNSGTPTGSVSPLASDITHMEVTPSPPSPIQRSSFIPHSRIDLTHAGAHGFDQFNTHHRFYGHPTFATEATMNNFDPARYRHVDRETLQTYDGAISRGGVQDRVDITSGSPMHGPSNTYESRTGERPSESDVFRNGLTPAGGSSAYPSDSSGAPIDGSHTGDHAMSPSVEWSTISQEGDESERGDDVGDQMDLSADGSSSSLGSDESEAAVDNRDQMDFTPDAEAEDSHPAADPEGRRMHVDSEPHAGSIGAQAHENTSSQRVVPDVDMFGAHDLTQFSDEPRLQLFQTVNVPHDKWKRTLREISAESDKMDKEDKENLQGSAQVPMVGDQGNAMTQDHGVSEDMIPENDMLTGEVRPHERRQEDGRNEKVADEHGSNHQMKDEVGGEKATEVSFAEAKIAADRITDDEMKGHETTNQAPVVEKVADGKVAEENSPDNRVMDDKAAEDDMADKAVVDLLPVVETTLERKQNAEKTRSSSTGADTHVSAPVLHANDDGAIPSTMQPAEGLVAESAADYYLISHTAKLVSPDGELLAPPHETIEELVKEGSEHAGFTAAPKKKTEKRVDKKEVEIDIEQDQTELIGEHQETAGESTDKEAEHIKVTVAPQAKTEDVMEKKEVLIGQDQVEHRAKRQKTVGDMTVREEKRDIPRGPVRQPAFLIAVDEAKVERITAMVQNLRAMAGLPPPDDEVQLPTITESDDTEGKLLPAKASPRPSSKAVQSTRRANEASEVSRSAPEDRISHPAPASSKQTPKAVKRRLGSDEALEERRGAAEDHSSHPAPTRSEPTLSEPTPSGPTPSKPAPSQPTPSEPAPKAVENRLGADEAMKECGDAPENRSPQPAPVTANALPSPVNAAEPQPAPRTNWVLDTDIWSPDMNMFFGDIAAAIRLLRDDNVKIKSKLTRATNKLKDHDNLMKSKDTEIAELRRTLDGRMDKLTGQHNKLVDRFMARKKKEEQPKEAEPEAEPAKTLARGGRVRGRGRGRGGKQN